MWREYTREKPARPFLAPLGAGLALAAALGLAWLVGEARKGSTASGLQSPPHWPVEFTLPKGFKWLRQTKTDFPAEDTIGSLVYEGRGPDLVPSVLSFTYAVLPEGTEPAEAAVTLLGQPMTDTRPIDMGPLEGVVMESRRGLELRALTALAVSEHGLAVMVRFASPRLGSRETLAFQAACRSIHYRKWWVSQPEDGVRLPNRKQ